VLFPDALQEVLAFSQQRFLLGNGHQLTIIFVSNRHAVNPVDAMRIQHQLAFRQRQNLLHVCRESIGIGVLQAGGLPGLQPLA